MMKYVNLDMYGRKEDSFFFACETVLLEDLKEDLFFIWRVYDAVIIGKHQLLEAEVNLDFTTTNDIKIFRRLSGGGAVYSDPGCIKYSFITKSADKDDVFKVALKKIHQVFARLNIETEISGRNDILYKQRKFSGNAYYKNKHGSCLHGTILYDTSIERLVKSITPSDQKLISKGISSVKSRVINMKEVVGLDIEEFTSVLVNDICEEAYFLNTDQLMRIDAYQKQYELRDFIFKKNPPYTYEYKERFECGTVGIKIDIHKNIIKDAVIYGDFFSKEPIEQLSSFLIGLDYTTLNVADIFKNVLINRYIIGLDNTMFYQLFMRGNR